MTKARVHAVSPKKVSESCVCLFLDEEVRLLKTALVARDISDRYFPDLRSRVRSSSTSLKKEKHPSDQFLNSSSDHGSIQELKIFGSPALAELQCENSFK
ncbi:hypothetical protein J6590_087697, partial [Homalodisca vitripennis]